MKQSVRWWLLLGTSVVACGGPLPAGKKGSVCFRDDDCVVGLVCVAPQGSNERVCTDDVSGIISEVDLGGVGAGGGAGSSAGGGGGATPGGAPSTGGMGS